MNVRSNNTDSMTSSASSSIERLAYPLVAQIHNESLPTDEQLQQQEPQPSFYDKLYKKDVENATLMIHRMIRSCEWDKINVLWCKGMLPYSIWTLPNGIGWTSLHFAAITSSNIPIHHWSFLIQTILYSTKKSTQSYQSPPPKLNSNSSTIGSEWNNISISESQSPNNSDHHTSCTASTVHTSESRKIITTDITLGQSITPSSSKSTPSSSPTNNKPIEIKSLKTSSPFWMTTDSGHSPIDLFFHHHLCPYQWQKPELNTNAIQLQQAIDDILSNQKKIFSLKLRIESNYHHHTKNIDEDAEEEPLNKRRRMQNQHYDENNIVAVCKNLDAVEVFWYRLEVLLMACCDYNGTYNDILDGEKKQWRVLHALAHTDCPKLISQLVLALYPNQVKERDENGNLPLHIASKFTKHSSFFLYHNGSLKRNDDCNPTQQNDALNVSSDETDYDRQFQSQDNPISTYRHYSIMAELLKAYPDASICPDGTGQLPLYIALQAGKSWDNGIQDLFLAAPQVVTNTFTPNGLALSLPLYPFQLAATKRSENDDEEEKNRKAKQYAFFKLGHLWTFLPQSSKDRAIQDGLNYIDNMKLNTVHELLLAAPNVVSLLLLEEQQK